MLLRASCSRLVALLLAIAWLVQLMVTPAHAQSAETPVHEKLQDTQIADDNTVRLADTAGPSPEIYGSYQRFGLYDSASIALPAASNQVEVVFNHTAPANTAARVDVRAQDHDKGWSEWQTDVASSDIVRFAARVQSVQYRVVLLSNTVETPTVGRVSFLPRREGMRAQSNAQADVAPTYRLRVTRQGMVGGRTANGHIIEPNDFFVSLPSDRALSSRDGNEYLVRLTANGRSIVVPVWDNGPWNHHDDYWNENRERYRDLPVGWPQDHAAYYENYNKGMSERGKVRFPSAVDIADGAYWALGLNGAQATVNVTFLWLGDDPGASAEPINVKPSERPKRITPRTPFVNTPPPAPSPSPSPAPTPPVPAEPVIELNDTDPAVVNEGPNWGITVDACGYGGQARSIRTVAREDDVSHQAVWRPKVRGGTYEVYAYVPACIGEYRPPTTARYIVHHARGDAFVTRSQADAAGKWLLLGRFNFAPGNDGYIQLRNWGGTDEATMWFDAVKLVPVKP